jgi:hypothetical protein
LRDSTFKDNEDAKKLTNHIKGLGFFEGVSEFKVKDFLVDAALHGSRLASESDTTNNAKKSLTELTGAALNEHLNNPGFMYETLKEYLGKTAKGLDEFHSVQANPTIELSDKQIANIYSFKKSMEALKSDSEKLKKIPDEVFMKFSKIYEDFSKRLQVKDLVLGGSNLVDRLSVLNPRSTNVDYFLSFFKSENKNILGNALKAQAMIFKNGLAELAKTLDPYGEDASTPNTICFLVLASTNDDGQRTRRRITRNFTRRLKSILTGHDDIHDHQMRWIAFNGRKRRFTIVYRRHVISLR